jgi:hypothetical protein
LARVSAFRSARARQLDCWVGRPFLFGVGWGLFRRVWEWRDRFPPFVRCGGPQTARPRAAKNGAPNRCSRTLNLGTGERVGHPAATSGPCRSCWGQGRPDHDGLHARVEPWRPRSPRSPRPAADACLRRDLEDYAHRPVSLRQWRKLEEWDRSGCLASTCDPGPPPAVLSQADQGPSYTGLSNQEPGFVTR